MNSSPPYPMPDNLQTGTSLYFQRTNTYFPVGIGEGQLPGFLEEQELGVQSLVVQSYKEALYFQPLLCITASNSCLQPL